MDHGRDAEAPFPEELREQSEELCRTRAWRFDQLTALGFDTVQAALMADNSLVELAQARRLVAMGCPLETASRILL
jgi:1,6-anhydro-N-acetylmuramate kinase